MHAYVIQKQKTKKFMLLNGVYFLFFLGLYTLLDSFNLSYTTMQTTYGSWLVWLNIAINILMALISALMLGLTTAQFDLSKKQSVGANASYLSVIFGVLTYGCTPCVIGFFAAFGISFSVAILPFAGLPYKLASLGLLILGLLWVLRSIQTTTCSLPSPPQQNDS